MVIAHKPQQCIRPRVRVEGAICELPRTSPRVAVIYPFFQRHHNLKNTYIHTENRHMRHAPFFQSVFSTAQLRHTIMRIKMQGVTYGYLSVLSTPLQLERHIHTDIQTHAPFAIFSTSFSLAQLRHTIMHIKITGSYVRALLEVSIAQPSISTAVSECGPLAIHPTISSSPLRIRSHSCVAIHPGITHGTRTLPCFHSKNLIAPTSSASTCETSDRMRLVNCSNIVLQE